MFRQALTPTHLPARRPLFAAVSAVHVQARTSGASSSTRLPTLGRIGGYQSRGYRFPLRNLAVDMPPWGTSPIYGHCVHLSDSMVGTVFAHEVPWRRSFHRLATLFREEERKGVQDDGGDGTTTGSGWTKDTKLLEVLRSNKMLLVDFPEDSQVRPATLEDWAKGSEDLKKDILDSAFPEVISGMRDSVLRLCIATLDRAVQSLQEPMSVFGTERKEHLVAVVERLAERFSFFHCANIEQLRHFVDSSIPHWTMKQYSDMLGPFAVDQTSQKTRKPFSFSTDGSLSNEGLFINGTTAPFDRKKENELVKPLLELARSKEKSTRVLLAKSGMGKTFTWYRMCSFQDSEEDNRNRPVFMILLSSLSDGVGIDASKEVYGGTLEEIMKFDSDRRPDEPAEIQDRNWKTIFASTFHLIDSHLAILRHIRQRFPELTPLDFLKLQRHSDYHALVRLIALKSRHLFDEERLNFSTHDTQDDTRFALVFDEVQALVKGRKAMYLKSSSESSKRAVDRLRTVASPILTACTKHPQFSLRAYSGSDYTLYQLQMVLSDIGGEHEKKVRIRSMPQLLSVDDVWEHMQCYLDLSGCEDLKNLLHLLVGRPRITSMVISWIAQRGLKEMRAILPTLIQGSPWIDTSHHHIEVRPVKNSTKVYVHPFTVSDSSTIVFDWPDQKRAMSESDGFKLLKPVVFAMAVREVYSETKDSLVVKLEKLEESLEPREWDDLVYKLKKILMSRILDHNSKGVYVNTTDQVDMLGLGLGQWVRTSRSSEHRWLLNEPVIFDAILQYLSRHPIVKENQGKLYLSDTVSSLLAAVNGNPTVSYKGGPAERVIGACFLQSDFLGKQLNELPFLSNALSRCEEQLIRGSNGTPNASLSNARSLLQSFQYGSVNQPLYVGTRHHLASMIFHSTPKDVTKSDIAFIEHVVHHFANHEPTVIVLHTFDDTGADIIVLVLNGIADAQRQRHVEFRVGIKTTGTPQIKASERKRNAVTTLLQGAYTHRDGKPITVSGATPRRMRSVVHQHDDFYGLPRRALEDKVTDESDPTAGNLPFYARMRVELSKSARTSGTEPLILENGKMIDITLDMENVIDLVQDDEAVDALSATVSRISNVKVRM